MSKERLEIIDCPNCGQKSEFIVWDSLNGDLDPHAKQMLMNGSLFKFKCAACGHEANVGYDILYHDMSHQAMIYLVRPEMVEETKKMMEATSQKLPLTDNYRKRIVTDQNHLREKALIFDAGYDDRLIEIIKVFMFAEAYKRNQSIDLQNTYFYTEGNTMSVQFICEHPLMADLPIEMYEDMKKAFAEKLDKVDNQETLIDSFWAMRSLSAWKE